MPTAAVQEPLVIPLYGRKMCSELYPNLYRDETAIRLMKESSIVKNCPPMLTSILISV